MYRDAVPKEPRKELLEARVKQMQGGEGGVQRVVEHARRAPAEKVEAALGSCVWNNCIVMYRTRRPEERALLAIPLFKLSSANGVLLSYKLDSESGAVAECQKGSIFLYAGHTVEALVWLDTVRSIGRSPRHLAAAVCSSSSTGCLACCRPSCSGRVQLPVWNFVSHLAAARRSSYSLLPLAD